MKQNDETMLLCKKQYERPIVGIVCMSEEVIRTSGQMTWGNWDDWIPNREDTMFE